MTVTKKVFKESFPQHKSVWRKLRPIQKGELPTILYHSIAITPSCHLAADLGRLVVLYVHGGLYVDVDVAIKSSAFTIGRIVITQYILAYNIRIIDVIVHSQIILFCL